jgi:deazaflavin-dependent oxidoreductase (nitroreductase family)
LYLTTRGRKTALPREIEIWFTQRDRRFYVIAEHPNSQWVENLRAHPEGQVRVADRSFKVCGRILSPEEPDCVLFRSFHAGNTAGEKAW